MVVVGLRLKQEGNILPKVEGQRWPDSKHQKVLARVLVGMHCMLVAAVVEHHQPGKAHRSPDLEQEGTVPDDHHRSAVQRKLEQCC